MSQMLEKQKSRRFSPGFYLACLWLLVIVVSAAAAPYIHLQKPDAQSSAILALPSSAHWFGTDNLGRDLFSRVIYGGRVSLLVGFLSIAIGLIIGGLMGMIAGFSQRLIDVIFNQFSNFVIAFPAIILLLAVITVEGQHLSWIVGVIAFLSIPVFFRISRASTLSVKQRDFILSAKVLGAQRRKILFSHILPNILPPVLSIAFIGVSAAIIAEGVLAYLGLSVKLPIASWGNLISQGAQLESYQLSADPWVVIWPSLAIILTTLSLNYIGVSLQRLFDRRTQRL